MGDIKQFKSKEQKLEEWTKAVIESHLKNIDKAIIITENTSGEPSIAYYNSVYDDKVRMKGYLEENILHTYLRNYLGEYLEYVN